VLATRDLAKMLVEEVDMYREGVRRLSTLAAHLEVGVRDLATRCLPRFDEVNAAVDDIETYNAMRLAENEADGDYSDFVSDVLATESDEAVRDIERALEVVRHVAVGWSAG
jgi:hypothetical protein